MLCSSAHTIAHVMGSFREDLVHGAGLIMTARAYPSRQLGLFTVVPCGPLFDLSYFKTKCLC